MKTLARSFIGLFLLLSFGYTCYSQDTLSFYKPKERKHIDTVFIRHYPELLTLGIFTASPIMNSRISSSLDSLNQYASNFLGNFSSSLGFTFGYRSVGFSYGFRVPVDPEGISQMGRSSFRVLGVKIRKNPFIINLDYRKYRGFYDDNTPKYDPSLPSNAPYNIRPDMEFRSYSGSILCNFSWRKYSYTAPISFTERQVRSRFGFLLKGAINYVTLSSDSSFINSIQQPFFPEFYNVRMINALIIKSGPGVGMNLVFFKRMYFSVALFFMGNNLLYRYKNEEEFISKRKYDINFFLEGNAALGFNSKRFYMGMRLAADNNVMRVQGARVQYNFGSFTIDLGMRLNTPRFFRETWKRTLTRYLKL